MRINHDGTNALVESSSGELQLGVSGNFLIDSGVNVGVGIDNPTSSLSILGSADIWGNATATGNMIIGASSWAEPTSTLTVDGSGYFTGDFITSGNATTSGYLVIGTTQPTINMNAGDLLIGGNSTTTGSFYVSGSSMGNTFRSDATSTLATTTASVINKVVIVDGVHYSADGAGIQAAINSLPSTGGKVFIPAGTYNMTSTTTLSSYVTLEGAGPTSTILYLADGADDPVLYATSAEGIRITNLGIDGNDGGNTDPSCHGIYFNNVDYSEIDNVWVYDAEDNGIYHYSGTNSVISNNILESNTKGIRLNSSSNNNVVTGNISSSNSEYGIQLYNCDDNTITGNTFNSNSQQGIHFNSSDDNTITGNTVNNNSRNGAYFGSCNNNSITGNTFNSNSYRGISLDNSSSNTISGNTIYDNGESDTYDGIYLNDDCDNNLISSNRIYDSQGSGSWYGINVEDANEDNNYIVGNEISGV